MYGGVIPSPWLRNVLFALFVGSVLAYGVAFAAYMLARYDLVNLLRDANIDDAFYYFQIAYHLADGKFSTFDGGITQTNGYHPLWLILITPFYWVFDKETALFGIKAFEIMLISGAVALIAVAAWLARLPWILLFALLPTLYYQVTLFSGMEAAAALFMLGLLFLTLMLYARNPARWRWPLAAVAFALPWVRLEYIAISLAATAALLVIEWSWQEQPAGAAWKESVRSVAALNAVAPLLGAVAGVLMYFAYNGIVFGGITPVSGASKQLWSQFQWEDEGGYSLAQNFRDVLQIPVFDSELLVALGICLGFPIVWYLARRSRGRDDWLLLAFLVGMFSLAIGHLAKFAQTTLTMHPLWASHDWYFVPAYLMMALIIPVVCCVSFHFIRHFIGPRSRPSANILSAGVIVAGMAFLFLETDFNQPFRYVDWESEQTDYHWGVTSYMGVQVMNRVLREDSVIGSWNAGVVGYFSRFPVVNLDGLVNSYDYYRARKEGLKFTIYSRYGITWFADDHEFPRYKMGAILFEAPAHSSNAERQFKFWPPELPGQPHHETNSSAWFWERMEPHFDQQSADVGMIVDGRMAQAFAKSCESNELAVWFWGEQGDEPALKTWTQTQTGLCVNVFVLPNDALPPVRVEALTASDYLAELAGDGQAAIRSDFDVHLNENRLIYVKEQCVEGDVAAMFFLHLVPADADDLPGHRRQYGFDNLDFSFRQRGGMLDGKCWAAVKLPEYAIAEIHTGQYARVADDFEQLWAGKIRLTQ